MTQRPRRRRCYRVVRFKLNHWPYHYPQRRHCLFSQWKLLQYSLFDVVSRLVSIKHIIPKRGNYVVEGARHVGDVVGLP